MDLPPYEEFENNVYYSEKTSHTLESTNVELKPLTIGFASRNFVHFRSMMSGHSPNAHREMFEFKETHSTPASTSKECDRGETILKGSALVDATDSVPINNTYTALNNTSNFRYIDSTLPCIDDKVPLAENEDLPNVSGTSDEQKDSSKLSDETNKPDDSWSQKDDKENENEEDFCLKCLYVSMKCCECTIM